MTLLLEMKFGYVSCDIDGEGYNACSVYRDDDASDQSRPFRYLRHSRCYGDIDKSGLTKSELLECLQDDGFMVSTVRARRTYRDFLRELKHGSYDRPVNARQAAASVNPVMDQWEQELLTPVEAPGWDPYGISQCPCPSCEEARADMRIQESAQFSYIAPEITFDPVRLREIYEIRESPL